MRGAAQGGYVFLLFHRPVDTTFNATHDGRPNQAAAIASSVPSVPSRGGSLVESAGDGTSTQRQGVLDCHVRCIPQATDPPYHLGPGWLTRHARSTTGCWVVVAPLADTHDWVLTNHPLTQSAVRYWPGARGSDARLLHTHAAKGESERKERLQHLR